ncbi:DNA helicase [Tanacetum coccineum]
MSSTWPSQHCGISKMQCAETHIRIWPWWNRKDISIESCRTTHLRFQIPLNLEDESICSIKKNSQLADLLRQTHLIIWDEAPMNDRRCFEALDRSLKDICNRPNSLFGALATLIEFIYDQKTLQRPTPTDLQKKAIVCPKNEDADMINAKILTLVNHHQHVYLSFNEAVPHGNDGGETELLYPPEYLNSLNFAGFPPHRLELKVGAPIILLRNLNISGGLCNGTRLIVTQLHSKVIEARIITGTQISEKVFLPCIPLINRDLQLPFIFKRKQFPVKLLMP